MPETIDLEILKRIPIFQGFTDAECKQLVDLSTIVMRSSGTGARSRTGT